MFHIEVGKGKSLDSALKELKSKVNKTGMVKELRERQQFTKKSVERRLEIKKAIYINSLKNNPE